MSASFPPPSNPYANRFTDEADPLTFSIPPFRFCAIKASVLAAIAAWPDGVVTWTLVDEVAGLTYEQLQTACVWAGRQWNLTWGGVRFDYTDTARNARLLVGSRRIDGPGSVLAECELPNGSRQIRMWFDTGDDWTASFTPLQRQIILPDVTWHEWGHALGIDHAPAGSPNIMAPIYNPKTTKAGPWDLQQAKVRYPTLLIPVAPPVTPTIPTPTVPTNPTNPTPSIPGGIMGLLQFLAKIAPFLKVVTDLAASGQLQTILDTLSKLAGAFGDKTAGVTAALSMGMTKSDLRDKLRQVAGMLKLAAMLTPGTDLDDKAALIFEQAVNTDWLLDLIALVMAGQVSEAELTAALAAAA